MTRHQSKLNTVSDNSSSWVNNNNKNNNRRRDDKLLLTRIETLQFPSNLSFSLPYQ